MLRASDGSQQHGLQLAGGTWLLAVVAFGSQRQLSQIKDSYLTIQVT